MAWDYNETLPSDKDRVRYLVGDTDDSDQLIEDEEIVFALIDNSNLYRAAAVCCRAVSARLARELTLVGSAGSVELDAQKQAEHFSALADKYDARAIASGGTGIFAGGISRSDKATRAGNADRVKPAFSVDLHRSPPINPKIEPLDDDS